ncbi:hypothetical protein Lal_00018401 [Lupinus albus]|nr:hypothetical protein Lal_00018401 [Lupinus albus]
MFDTNDSEAFNILTPEFLNSLATFGLPNHNMKLKVGTLMANHVLDAKIMSGKNNGNIIYIPRL